MLTCPWRAVYILKVWPVPQARTRGRRGHSERRCRSGRPAGRRYCSPTSLCSRRRRRCSPSCRGRHLCVPGARRSARMKKGGGGKKRERGRGTPVARGTGCSVVIGDFSGASRHRSLSFPALSPVAWSVARLCIVLPTRESVTLLAVFQPY